MCVNLILRPRKVGSDKSFLNIFSEARVTMHVRWCAAFLWVNRWERCIVWCGLWWCCLSVYICSYTIAIFFCNCIFIRACLSGDIQARISALNRMAYSTYTAYNMYICRDTFFTLSCWYGAMWSAPWFTHNIICLQCSKKWNGEAVLSGSLSNTRTHFAILWNSST